MLAPDERVVVALLLAEREVAALAERVLVSPAVRPVAALAEREVAALAERVATVRSERADAVLRLPYVRLSVPAAERVDTPERLVTAVPLISDALVLPALRAVKVFSGCAAAYSLLVTPLRNS